MKIARPMAAISMALAAFVVSAANPEVGLAQGAAPVPMVLISQANEAGFPLWLAKKLNYFADNGIDARIQYFPNGGAALSSVPTAIRSRSICSTAAWSPPTASSPMPTPWSAGSKPSPWPTRSIRSRC